MAASVVEKPKWLVPLAQRNEIPLSRVAYLSYDKTTYLSAVRVEFIRLIRQNSCQCTRRASWGLFTAKNRRPVFRDGGFWINWDYSRKPKPRAAMAVMMPQRPMARPLMAPSVLPISMALEVPMA